MLKYFYMWKKPLFIELCLVFLFFLFLDILAYKYDLYYWNIGGEFDSFMHFGGGLFSALFFLWLFFFSGFFKPENRSYSQFFKIGILGLVFVAFLWEIYELVFGVTFTGKFDYSYDTTLDIIFDFFGAVIACIYAYNKERLARRAMPEGKLYAN